MDEILHIHANSSSGCSLFFFNKYFIYLFLEKGEEREKERERKYHCVVASHMPSTRDLPETQAYALSGNQTSDLLVCKPALSPLSHTSQG